MIIHSSFSDIDLTQWKELDATSPTASFFQTPECYEFYASLSFIKPFVFGVSENNKLVGVICGFISSDGNILSRYLSRRAIVSGGALLDSEITEAALKLLLNTARETLKSKAIYFEIRNYNNYSPYKAIFEEAGFIYSPHLNFHVSTPDVPTAQKNLNTTKRRHIKVSVKEGVEWNDSEDLNDVKEFYNVLEYLYKTKVKTPLFPFEFFEKLVQLPSGILFVVKHLGKVVGGSFCVLHPNRTIYEWFVCGMDGETKNVYPSTIATWAAIEYASTNGYRCFDMMGAGKPDDGYGVREFKSKFGGELVENGRFLNIGNPFLYKIGKMAVNTMRKKNRKKNTDSKIPLKVEQELTLKVEHNFQNIDKQEWSDFVLNHPNGNIFQTPEMFEVYKKTPKFIPFILIVKNVENKMVGCLMSVIQREYKGILGALTTRSIIMGGPLAEKNNTEVINLLIQNYNKLVSGKAIYSQFRNLFDAQNYIVPFDKNGYNFDEHLDILINLHQSKEELEQLLHKERKRNITKAVKEGLTFKLLTEERDILEVISLLKKTYTRVKVPFSYEKLFFNTTFSLENNVKFFGAFWEDKMIAGQVRLCYKDTVYAWYAGSDSDYFQKRPNDFLLWNVILWSKENNYRVFDFGGAGKPNVPYGVRDYKLKFGGELVNYGRYEKVHNKALMEVGKTAYKLYKLFKK